MTSQTPVEKFIRVCHEHKIASIVVIIGIIVVALGTFTESLDRMLTFSQKHIFQPGSTAVSTLSESEESIGPAWEAKIEVNPNLTAITTVKGRLQNAAIPFTLFENSAMSSPPKKFLISFGRYVPVKALQQILRLLSDVRLDSIQFLPGPPYESRIIIGSYGYLKAQVVHGPYLFEQEPIATLDPDFVAALLAPDISADSLVDLVVARARHEERISQSETSTSPR